MITSWTTIKLGAIVRITMGQAPLGSTYNEKKEGIPLIAGAGDLGTTYPNPNRWTTSPTQICQKGDLIFCVRATVGVMNWADKEYCLGRGVAAIRPNSDLILAEYLYYCLIAHAAEILRFASGSTFIQIRRQDLDGLSIPLPPLPEQRRIASILREADEIRKLRQQASEKTQRIVEALFYDMFGDPVTWQKTIPLEQCVNFVGGGTPNTKIKEYFQGDIPWATSKDIKERYLYNTQDHITQEAIQHSSTKLVPENTILLVVKSKILMHSLPMSITMRSVCFGQDLKGLICKTGFEPQFILASLAMQKKRILDSARGVNTEGLTLELLRNIPIPQINSYVQTKFIEITEIYDDLLLDNKENKLYLDVLYQSLLSQAFTGELTATWREQHLEELAQVARRRDALLQNQQTILVEAQIPSLLLLPTQETGREDLTEQLSPLQQALLTIFASNAQIYFTANQLHEDYEEELQRIHNASLDQVRRELRTLEAQGLIKEVTLEVEVQPGHVEYPTAYRYPQPDDDTMHEDLALLVTRSA